MIEKIMIGIATLIAILVGVYLSWITMFLFILLMLFVIGVIYILLNYIAKRKLNLIKEEYEKQNGKGFEPKRELNIGTAEHPIADESVGERPNTD